MTFSENWHIFMCVQLDKQTINRSQALSYVCHGSDIRIHLETCSSQEGGIYDLLSGIFYEK